MFQIQPFKLFLLYLFTGLSLPVLSIHAKAPESLLISGNGIEQDTTLKNRYGHIKGDFSVSQAMEIVYGLYDREMECSQWICKVPEEKAAFAKKISEDGMLYTRPEAHYEYSDPSGTHVLLVTGTLERTAAGWEYGHVSAPILGLVLFTLQGDEWFVESLKKDLGEIGSWGVLPQNQLVKLGTDIHALQLNYGYTAQGVTEGGTKFIGLVDGVFTELLDVRHSDYSNEGHYYEDFHPEKAFSYASRIEIAKDAEGFGDISFHFKGRRPLAPDTAPKAFEETRRFIFNGKEYIPSKHYNPLIF